MPVLCRRRVTSFALLGLLVAAGLLTLALRPMFASASPSLAIPQPAVAEPRPAPGHELRLVDHPAPTAGAVPGRRPVKAKPRAYLTARVDAGTVKLRATPGGRLVTTLGATTEFGSPRALSVVDRRGRWLAVVAPELGNGNVAWIDSRREDVEVEPTRLSVSIDLSRRLLVVKRGADVVRRVTIGVGAPGSATPIGRFAVTDKLEGSRYGPFYGCCILALSAKQPNLPVGWRGGDRIAVHGTDEPGTIGQASSAGCPHASDADMRYLMRTLPLGTPVFIHP